MCKIEKFIKNFEAKNDCVFKPTKNFYTYTSIRQKRWGQLIRNEVKPQFDELLKLAEYFKIDVSEFLN